MQTWNGSSRLPDNTSIYSTTPSTTECHFQCLTNYTRDAGTSTCLAPTQSVSCTTPPTNAVANTATTITQTWDGGTASRLPSNTSTYNTSASTTQCYYQCSNGYTRNGSNACNVSTYISTGATMIYNGTTSLGGSASLLGNYIINSSSLRDSSLIVS